MNRLNENQLIENQLQSAYWIDDMKLFTIHFQFDKEIKQEDLLIDLTELRLIKVKIYFSNKVCLLFSCSLPSAIKDEFECK